MLTTFPTSESWVPLASCFVTHLGFKGYKYGVINMGSDTRWMGQSHGRWVSVPACREGLLGRLYFTFILQGVVALALM